MGFEQLTYYMATCDVRLGTDPAGAVVVIDPTDDDWAAYREAGRPDTGPEKDAVGTSCGHSDRFYAPSAAAARRAMQTGGWKIQSRGNRDGWKAACPDHREHPL